MPLPLASGTSRDSFLLSGSLLWSLPSKTHLFCIERDNLFLLGMGTTRFFRLAIKEINSKRWNSKQSFLQWVRHSESRGIQSSAHAQTKLRCVNNKTKTTCAQGMNLKRKYILYSMVHWSIYYLLTRNDFFLYCHTPSGDIFNHHFSLAGNIYSI